MTTNVAPEALSWSYGYDALDRLTGLKRGVAGNATHRSADYDVAGRLWHWTDRLHAPGTPYTVCQDPNQITGEGCTTFFPTDTTVLRGDTYAYDAVGNRTDHGAVLQSGNRLTSFDGFAMSYDADGNLLSKVGPGLNQSFVWNALGQLESVTTNGSTTSFGYDGLGRRIRKTLPSGAVERYIYDGDNLVIQTNAALAPVREYSYYPGIDHPHAVRNSATGAVFYYLTSGAGNVTALVNQSGQVANQYEYAPFGETIAVSEQVAQPFRFAAREFDVETGLYYNRARYYDPRMARFISEDPIGLAGGVNEYAYVGNDPLNARDPSGLSDDDCRVSNKNACRIDGITVTATDDGRENGWSTTPGDRGGRPWAREPRYPADPRTPTSPNQDKSRPKRISPTCTETPPMSSSGISPYSATDTYLGVSAREMFKYGGDGQWGRIARSCLQCAYTQANPPTMAAAHAACYAAADQRTSTLQQARGGVHAVIMAGLILNGQTAVQTAWFGKGLMP